MTKEPMSTLEYDTKFEYDVSIVEKSVLWTITLIAFA